MLIIVEGCDGVGKTTFVGMLDRLIRSMNPRDKVDVWHAGPPKRHPLDEYERSLWGYKPGRGRHIICDRWHWGEEIYPEVFGRDTQYDLAVRRHIELFLSSRGALIVHLTDDPNVIRSCILSRGDELIRPDQVDHVVRRYSYLASRGSAVTHMTFTGITKQDDVEEAINSARVSEAESRDLSMFTTYVGPRWPKILVLGDVRHHVENVDPRAPAFGPYPATSGHYLLTHMQFMRNVGVANACDIDDWRVMITTLGAPNIVTLGVQAHKKLRDFPHGTAPHPQFIRRFHHRAGEAYGEIITKAMQGEDRLGWRP